MEFPTCAEALRALLDRVDYTAKPTDCMADADVCEVVDPDLIALCREALSHPGGAEARALGVMSRGLMAIMVTAEAKGLPSVETLRTAIKSIMFDALVAARSGASPDEPPATLHRSGFR